MGIAIPVLAVVLTAMSLVTIRQARRAWRDPDWEPGSLSQSPRSPVVLAVLMVSLAVTLAGGSVFIDVAGNAAKDAGAGLVCAGLAGLGLAVIGMSTTQRFGRPRFLVPPPMRPSYEQTLPAVPAGPTVAGIQAAEASRAHLDSPDDGEFIVIAGPGAHLTADVSDAGRLVLTTRRLILSTRRPNMAGQERSWPVADVRAAVAGPGDNGLTLRFADGHREVFTVDRHRDLWLDRTGQLLARPKPVTSWYGDPADADRAFAVPDGQAVLVLWRAQAEQRDRRLGYRVLLDGHQVAKIKRGGRVELPVTPGRHVIRLKSIWVGSRSLRFQAHTGQVVRFCCEPGGFPGMTQADMERDVTGYVRLWRL
jgi:hypothetical protein